MNRKAQTANYDIYLVGVGGQGVLTLSDLIAETAVNNDVPVSLYPTKGMAQRGGSVKVQVRLGRELVGPNMPERRADLVIAMELSEALKAVRFVKGGHFSPPGSDFLLYGHVWAPTAVMLGQAEYPTLEQVQEQVQEAGCRLHYLDPKELPLYEGAPVAANVYVLGAAAGRTGLGEVLKPSDLARTVENRWKKAAERNGFAFQAGLESMDNAQ